MAPEQPAGGSSGSSGSSSSSGGTLTKRHGGIPTWALAVGVAALGGVGYIWWKNHEATQAAASTAATGLTTATGGGSDSVASEAYNAATAAASQAKDLRHLATAEERQIDALRRQERHTQDQLGVLIEQVHDLPDYGKTNRSDPSQQGRAEGAESAPTTDTAPVVSSGKQPVEQPASVRGLDHKVVTAPHRTKVPARGPHTGSRVDRDSDDDE